MRNLKIALAALAIAVLVTAAHAGNWPEVAIGSVATTARFSSSPKSRRAQMLAKAWFACARPAAGLRIRYALGPKWVICMVIGSLMAAFRSNQTGGAG
jgi:membrane protein DedA with SNARE-associated domain